MSDTLTSRHTLAHCLAAIARHHGLSVDPSPLIQRYGASEHEPDAALLQRMASDIGLSSNAAILSWKQLLKRQNGFPLLARLIDGQGVVIVGVRVTGAGKIAVLDPRVQPVKVRWMGRQSFCRYWRGEVMLIKPLAMSSIQDELIRGIELQQQGRINEAAQIFQAVLLIDPNHPAALYSLAVIALNGGRLNEALRLTQSGIATSPGFAPLWFAHGSVLQALERRQDALDAFDEALLRQPDYVDALVNSGVLLRDFYRHHEALERFNRVLTFKPDHVTALANCAILLTEFKQSEQAIRMFERLLELQPDYDYGLGMLSYERLHICDWTDYEPLVDKILEGVRVGRRVCKTLALMAICDSAEDHFRAANIFAESYYPRQPIALWQGEHYRHDRIRIAYVSADLREHPVGHLMAGIFEHHDKLRFETIAISVGIDDQSRLRKRMVKVFDHFIDARLMGSRQIAEKMREMEVDIAIDLSGYTSDSRIQVFAYRPAPVQVGYLGYPGTLGTDYMDYIIADRHVIPEEHQSFYSERVIYLPDTYLPTDDSIQISELTPTRAECGLPETGFVFCSFSHDYKISPQIFAVWMRLLKQVSGSVLWLMSRNGLSQRNLCREAERHGIEPARLIFASRVPRVEDHLARYRQSDLFLDTHPYNAHTTAADALMSGLPVVTYVGDAFPARVAGSLLRAIGMPELITYSLEEYEALALGLATHPERLADIKQHLLANRATQPLFDTRNFCRNLEALYLDIWRRMENVNELDPSFSSQLKKCYINGNIKYRQSSGLDFFSARLACKEKDIKHYDRAFFISNLRSFFPAFFNAKKVLEIGSLNLDGSVRAFFDGCDYLGIDFGPGPGVDRIFSGQDFPGKAQEFDFIIAAEVFEHTEQWDAIFLNMLRMLKRDGFLVFTCASYGRPQHGTAHFDPDASSLKSEASGYYKNLIENDFISAFQLDYWFSSYAIFRDRSDLYFAGIGMKDESNSKIMSKFKVIYEDYLYKKNILGLSPDLLDEA